MCLMASNPECTVLNWNVRGLNNPARRQVVRDLVADHHGTIVCLQETKLQTVDDAVITTTLGHQFTANCASLSVDGTQGGIILACSQDYFTMSQVHVLQHSTTTTITSMRNNEVWIVTGVYGPQDDPSKLIFLQELRQIKLLVRSSWALLGDFNLIYRAPDKNNPRVNIRMRNQFKTLLDELEVKEHKPEFKQIVQESWAHSVQSGNKMKALHIKLARLGKNLRAWSKQKTKEMRREADEARALVLRLDQKQDNRVLDATEINEHMIAKDSVTPRMIFLITIISIWIMHRICWLIKILIKLKEKFDLISE
jgi:exonuclease III